MIVSRGLGRGGSQMIVTAGLGRRAVNPAPIPGGGRATRWRLPVRVSLQHRDEDDLMLLIAATLIRGAMT